MQCSRDTANRPVVEGFLQTILGLAIAVIALEWISSSLNLPVISGLSKATNIIFFMIIVIGLITQVARTKSLAVLTGVTGQIYVAVIIAMLVGKFSSYSLELLLKVAREHPEVLKDPEPIATFNGFGDYFLDFTLYYWISGNIFKNKTEVALGVHDAIKAAGINTPRPQQDLNLKIIDNPDKKRKPGKKGMNESISSGTDE